MKVLHEKVRILHLEDAPVDAVLVSHLLKKVDLNCDIKVVDTRRKFEESLTEFRPDIIISDNSLPSFDSLEALRLVKDAGLHIPFILFTGTVSEDYAIEIMREGAADYLLKDRPQRLGSAIYSALESAILKNEQKEAEGKIRKTEKRYAELVQHLPANIAILDKAGTIVDVNASWKKFATENGFTGENYGIGDNYFDFCQITTEGMDFKGEVVGALREVISGVRESFSMVYPCHSLTERRWFRLIASREGQEADSGIVVMHINVTEQRMAQFAIEQSEAKYRSFFENSMDGILITNPKTGEIEAANPTACTLFQRTEQEICAIGKAGLVDYADPRLKLLIKKREETGTAKGELTFVRKDKSQFPAEIASSIFMDVHGQVRSMMIIRDLTERKIADNKIILTKSELQKLNNRLLLATRSGKMGIWECEVASGRLVWDEGMQRIYNVPANQFESHYTEWLACMHPEDRERVNEEIELALGNTKEYDTEFRIIWSDSTVRFIRATGIVERDEEGKAMRMIGMNWDITQERINEEKMRKSELLLSNIDANSADMICSVSEDGKFIHVSAACQNILGYLPDEMSNQCLIDFVWREDREKTMAATAQLIAQNSLSNFENRYVRKDGSLVSLVWSVRWDEKDRIRYGVARDATEMKIAEQKIAAERKRITDLVTNSPVGMCILKGKEHVYELANDEYLRLSGRKNIIGRTVQEVFPEVALQGVNELLDSVFQTGEYYANNELLIQIDVEGSGKLADIYLNLLYQPYFNLKGEVEGIYYFGVDITEQVLSRKKIEEAEKKYRQIIETAREGIWVIDEKEKTTFANTRLCELLGYSSEEMIGKDLYSFMDEEGFRITSNGMADRKGGNAAYFQSKYITKTNEELWANVSANPLFDGDGRYMGALAMITDVTDQKKIEVENEKLARIASLTVNAVVVTDAAGKITWVNNGFERITEYSLDEVVGRKPGSVLQGLATEAITIHEMRDCIGQEKGFRGEILNYSKSGRKYWVDIEIVPLKDSNGKLTGFMAIQQDITERKKSEQDTYDLVKNLQKRNQDLQQFSYIISHNLRAPIAKISGLTSIIQPDNEENKFLMEKIHEETELLDEVIKDINLIISARKSEREKMEFVWFQTECKLVQQSLEIDMLESGAQLISNFSEAEGIFTIKSYLYSILHNLVSNAIKYRMRDVPLTILIESKQDESFICLSVKDNGSGIDLEKHKSKLFGLYKRFHGTDIPGKGIGLHLVKTHVESVGGHVEIESKLKEGTEFKIYLPKIYGNSGNN